MLAGSLSSADQKRSWRDLNLSPCAVKRAGIVDGILAENNYIRRSNAIVARSVCATEASRPWIAGAHRDDGKRYVVRADEKLTAFMELESAIRK
jgi:hypothetical protein